MSVTITWSVDGIWSWLTENPNAIPKARIVRAVRRAQKNAFSEWCQMKPGANVGLGLRFSERGFGLLNLTPRSRTYRKQQRRVLGKELPYTSPRGSVDGPSGSMRNDVLSGGYSITNLNKSQSYVTTQLSVTGARQLNRLGSKGNAAIYRHEFLGFDGGGRADAKWILDRSHVLILDYLKQDIARAQRKQLKGVRKPAHVGPTA